MHKTAIFLLLGRTPINISPSDDVSSCGRKRYSVESYAYLPQLTHSAFMTLILRRLTVERDRWPSQRPSTGTATLGMQTEGTKLVHAKRVWCLPSACQALPCLLMVVAMVICLFPRWVVAKSISSRRSEWVEVSVKDSLEMSAASAAEIFRSVSEWNCSACLHREWSIIVREI